MTSVELLFLVTLCVAGVMRSACVMTITTVVENMKCDAMQVRPFTNTDDVPNSDVLIFTVRTCPADYPHNETRSKCEQNEDSQDLDIAVPVLHMPTGNVYRNTYCTACNGLASDTLSQWSVHVSCVDDHYWPLNFGDMVTAVRASTGCNILFQYPADVPPIFPSTCTPGELLFCDLRVKSVCQGDSSNVSVIYCYWEKDQVSVDNCAALESDTGTPEATFSLAMRYEMAALPDYTLTDSTPDPTCSEGTYPDEFKNVCRGVQCGVMRKLVNDTCPSIVQEIRGATVKFALMMTPLDNLSNISPDLFANMSDELLTHGVSFVNHFSLDDNSRISLLYSATNRTDADVGYVLDVGYYVLYVRVSIPHSMSVETDVLDAILNSHSITNTLQPGNITILFQFVTVTIETDANLGTYYYNEALGDVLQVYDTHRGSSFISLHDPNRYTLLPTSGPCPLVKLSVDEFGIQNFTYFIRIPELAVFIGKWDIVEIYNADRFDSVLLCVDAYDDMIRSHISVGQSTSSVTQHPTNPLSTTTTTSNPPVVLQSSTLSVSVPTAGLVPTTTTSNPSASVKMPRSRISPDLLILICSCLSIACLLATILTYGMFRELRTMTSTNNILLCIFLIFAQAFLPFTTVKHEITDGSTRYLPEREITCRTVGGFTHLFWLIVSAWLNVCCFHSAYLQITSRINKRRSKFVSVMYVTVLGFVPSFVGIVISAVGDSNISDFENLRCFIFETEILWCTFVLPIACTLVFAAAIYLVSHFRFSFETDSYETRFSAYAALSALVGCVWAFGLAYMSSGHIFFKMMLGVFNVALGAYVLWVFVGSRRCVRLYRMRFRDTVSRGSSRRNTSTVHVQVATEKV